MRVHIANAPVSWGVEHGFEAPLPYGPMLDELKRAGYEGTELGPYGYMPTEPKVLGGELERRSLRLVSAFVPIELKTKDAPLDELAEVAHLLSALGSTHVVLADVLWPVRTRIAGRAAASDVRLSSQDWSRVETNLGRAGEVARGRGLRPVLHHHVGTYIETPDEVADVLDRTSIGLCLDTGHYVYGGGDPVEAIRAFGSRIDYLHLKDVDPRKLDEVRREELDFAGGVAAGVFCSLGEGCVRFDAVFEELDRLGFDGWAVIEQDIDPTGKTGGNPLEAACRSREFLRALLPALAKEAP
jgi:inosose dehydratase